MRNVAEFWGLCNIENHNERRPIMKIEFETFENIIEFLPAIYYYKQSYRQRFGKGVVVLAWLKWGIVIYKKPKK